MKISAGLLPYRRIAGLEVMIAHPGGPYFARRDAGHWSVIKGELVADEEARVAAAREFTEETGWVAPTDNWIDLGSVRLLSGKIVVAWAVEADFTEPWNPGTFRMIWHGRLTEFPEIDEVRWCDPDEATRLLNPAQINLVTRLSQELNR